MMSWIHDGNVLDRLLGSLLQTLFDIVRCCWRWTVIDEWAWDDSKLTWLVSDTEDTAFLRENRVCCVHHVALKAKVLSQIRWVNSAAASNWPVFIQNFSNPSTHFHSTEFMPCLQARCFCLPKNSRDLFAESRALLLLCCSWCVVNTNLRVAGNVRHTRSLIRLPKNHRQAPSPPSCANPQLRFISCRLSS